MIDIRTIVDSDAYDDGVWQLGHRSFGEDWPDNFRDPEELRQERTEHHVCLTVAVDDTDQILGFALVSPQRAAGDRYLCASLWTELRFIAVAEPSRGQNIGTRLHNAALATALQHGRLGIMGTVHPDTVGFWRHLGWEIGPFGFGLSVPDAGTARAGLFPSWEHPADPAYPIFVWCALDADRPVRAFTWNDRLTEDDIRGELERQRLYLDGTSKPAAGICLCALSAAHHLGDPDRRER